MASIISIEKEAVGIDLEATLFCGQAFRWQRLQGGYEAVVYDKKIWINQQENVLYAKSSTNDFASLEALDEFITTYFQLQVSFDIISKKINETQPYLYKRILSYKGLKVLKQHPFEMLISYMCAQGLGIQLVRNQVERLCRAFGKKIDDNWFAFPLPESLANASLAELQQATNNNAIRAKNIHQAALSVKQGGFVLEELTSYTEARAKLMALQGIGPKIAYCICLFGLGFSQAVPIDRHVKDFLWQWFGLRVNHLGNKNYEVLAEQARDALGSEWAGTLHQIFFHCWRIEEKGLKAV